MKGAAVGAAIAGAEVSLRSRSGAQLFTTSDDNGAVHVVLRVHGLPEGRHGVHFHAMGV